MTDLILKFKSNHDFTNAFIYAISSRSTNICQYLLDKKVYINFEQVSSSSSVSSAFLYKACFYNKIDVVESLLKLDRIDVNIYEVDFYYNTPLMASIEKNYTRIAELLIQNPKTDLNMRNLYDESALIITVKNEQKFIVDH